MSAADQDAQSQLLAFLGWSEPKDDKFGQDVSIVLASAEFSKELTSSVLWLNDHGLNIRCVRLKPYELDTRMLVDVQQIIPLPEAEEYQVQIREKAQRERTDRTSSRDFTRFDVEAGDEQHEGLSKRGAIRVVVRYLVQHGVHPREVAKLLHWREDFRIWCVVENEVDADQFNRIAQEWGAKVGQAYDRSRWFNEPEDLLVVEGRTYAFSNQWGDPNWRKAMDTLRDAFPQFRINYFAAGA